MKLLKTFNKAKSKAKRREFKRNVKLIACTKQMLQIKSRTEKKTYMGISAKSY